MKRLLPLVALAGLGACAHADPALVEAAKGAQERAAIVAAHGKQAASAGARAVHGLAAAPALSNAPGPQGPRYAPDDFRMASPDVQPTQANSLWRAGARSFFNDQRASRIGDILTVRIDIDDSAEVSNSSTRSRNGTASVGVSSLFGKEESLGRLLPPGGNFDPTNLVDAQGSSSAQGTGSINREERVALTVAAVITDVLPNGNLIVEGRQEVRINAELRELTVAGVIRPEDITAENTIRHTQMAEARISYGGRGQISAVQRPRLGQRIVDAVSPF